jgi:hypothetical protein
MWTNDKKLSRIDIRAGAAIWLEIRPQPLLISAGEV